MLDSLHFGQESLRISKELGYRQGEAAALRKIVAAESSLGNHGAAIQFYQDALALVTTPHLHLDSALKVENDLAVEKWTIGDYEDAKRLALHSVSAGREGGTDYPMGLAFRLDTLGSTSVPVSGSIRRLANTFSRP